MSLPDSATLIPAARQPLTIDARGRRCERRLGVLALLALAIATNLLPLPLALAALLYMIVATLVLAGLWWHGWLGGARRLTGVSRLADGRWLLTDAAQATLPAILSPHSRVGSHWLWLRWHIGAGADRGPRRRSMLLVQGDIEGRHLRRLGVRLRLESVRAESLQARIIGA